MTPARTRDVPRRHLPPAAPGRRPPARPAASAEAEPRREHSQPAGPLAPAPALGAPAQVRVEGRPGHVRRQLLAVDAGGKGGTELTAVHPAIVPAAAAAPRTTPRPGGRGA
ncbi:hypothetical protein GCM10009544_46360 [Streptomyces stramineus]|uniref:Uncharacterized protein n=1 Tax=Streptomyces stramineus TaxID=173861 RepID=A0ABN1AL16_9ACTN